MTLACWARHCLHAVVESWVGVCCCRCRGLWSQAEWLDGAADGRCSDAV